METTISQLEKGKRARGFSNGKQLDFVYFYRGCSFRWEDDGRNCDPERHEEKSFLTLGEAIAHVDNIDHEIGFSGVVDRIEIEEEDLIEFIKEDYYCEDNEVMGQEFNLKEIDYRSVPSFDSEQIYSAPENKGEVITGAVIVEWSYERYVGYARNLKQIGVAGQWPFHDFKDESDLVSGNEERTFHSNYSVLLTPQEVEDSSDLEMDIANALNDGHWKWNHFQNNPNSENIQDSIKEICIK